LLLDSFLLPEKLGSKMNIFLKRHILNTAGKIAKPSRLRNQALLRGVLKGMIIGLKLFQKKLNF